jgi:cbb3-type cytochrome oxidase subunit 3
MHWHHMYVVACTIALLIYLFLSLLACLWIIFSELFARDARRERERR